MFYCKKILAPTDLSPVSLTGVRHAVEIAESLRSHIVVLHVIDYEEVLPMPISQGSSVNIAPYVDKVIKERTDTLKKILSEVVEQPEGVTISPLVKVGRDYKTIIEVAETDQADLIVMCTNGRSGLSQMFLGSVTEQVVRRAKCPVLAIKPDDTA